MVKISRTDHLALWSLVTLLVVLCLQPPSADAAAETICSQPYILMCDNFEDRASGLGASTPGNTGWDQAFPTAGVCSVFNLNTNSVNAYNGSKSLEVPFTAGSNNGPGYCFSDLTDRTRQEVYVRWYQKDSPSFVYSLSNKNLYLMNAPGNMGVIHGNRLFGQDGTYLNSTGDFFAYSANIDRTKWVCVEVRDKRPSSTTVTDAQVTVWLDGVQVQNLTGINSDNVNARDADRAIAAVEVSGFWNIGTPPDWPDTHPAQTRWYDNIVVGTQRIGCLGSADTLPPAKPRNLRLR